MSHTDRIMAIGRDSVRRTYDLTHPGRFRLQMLDAAHQDGQVLVVEGEMVEGSQALLERGLVTQAIITMPVRSWDIRDGDELDSGLGIYATLFGEARALLQDLTLLPAFEDVGEREWTTQEREAFRRAREWLVSTERYESATE